MRDEGLMGLLWGPVKSAVLLWWEDSRIQLSLSLHFQPLADVKDHSLGLNTALSDGSTKFCYEGYG